MAKFGAAAAITLFWSLCYLVSANNYAEIVKNHRIAEKCGEKEACVRFCCDDKTICNDSGHFNLNSLEEASNLNPEYAVIIGRPNCEMYQPDESWEFSDVSSSS